jgi:hypothetical protein
VAALAVGATVVDMEDTEVAVDTEEVGTELVITVVVMEEVGWELANMEVVGMEVEDIKDTGDIGAAAMAVAMVVMVKVTGDKYHTDGCRCIS